MLTKALAFTVSAICVIAAYGQNNLDQPVARTLRFAEGDSPDAIQEIAVVIRATAELRHVSSDIEQRTLSAQGTGDQIALAEWLFNELEKPTQLRQATVAHEYRHPSASDDIVRVFYLAHAPTPHDVQELATVVRSMADIRLAFTYNPQKAIIFRTSAETLDLAEWLVKELDKPVEHRQHLKQSSYGTPVKPDELVRVFYLANTEHVHDLQEIATAVRSIASIRRVFTYNNLRAVTVRAPADQVAAAEWLFAELDKPSGQATAASGGNEYRTGGNDDVMRVFRLPQATTVPRLQETAVSVRSQTGLRYVFTYNAPRAVAVRGTAEQVAAAERLVAQAR